MFVSNVTRVGCEIESPDVRLPRIFYILSIPCTNDDPVQGSLVSDEDEEETVWSKVYASEVLTDSTFEGWQPLGKRVFPLGLPRMRAQTLLKLDLYECHAGEERDKYPSIREAGGIEEGPVDGLHVGAWIVRFTESGPAVDVIRDEFIGKIRLFLDMRDQSRIYLVSPVVLILPGKNTVESGKKQPLSLDDVRQQVVGIHDLQRMWQRERNVCLQRKQLCLERCDVSDDVETEPSDLEAWKARYYILQQRKIDMIRSIDENATTVEDIRMKQKIKLQALLNTAQALVQASGKVRLKKVALEGVSGQGTVDAMSQQVEARRAIILSEIRRMYHVCKEGPLQDHGEEPQVENHMEQRWSGIESPSSSHQGSQHCSYTIRNCRVHDDTWKHAFDKDGHHYDDPDADRETSIALGYMAHIMQKISGYFDIPLRYPITFRGSYSIIRDNYNRDDEKPREFPLYCESFKERPKYAIAVFLLNKDIVQILTHLCFLRDPTQKNLDIQNSPNYIAQNLYNLLTFYEMNES